MSWDAINPLYSISGFFVGVLVGFTGVGGGSLMTPLLVLLFGIVPATAVGTDLLYASITKCSGTLVHGLNKTIEWKIVRRLAAGSVPATAAALVLLNYLGAAKGGAHNLITTTLGFALILTAITLLFRKWLLSYVAKFIDGISPAQTRNLTVLLGVFLGVVVSISSVGAGAIGVTVLILLYPRLETVKIVGSDIAHAVPLTFIAGMGHWYLGSIDFPMLASLLVGSLPGIAIGSYFAAKVPDRVLRPILASTLMVVGARLAI